MRLGLILIGIMLIVGGVAGITNDSTYRLTEHYHEVRNLPLKKRAEPEDTPVVYSKEAGWLAIGAGVLVVSTSFAVRRLRFPRASSKPPVGSESDV